MYQCVYYTITVVLPTVGCKIIYLTVTANCQNKIFIVFYCKIIVFYHLNDNVRLIQQHADDVVVYFNDIVRKNI